MIAFITGLLSVGGAWALIVGGLPANHNKEQGNAADRHIRNLRAG